MPAVVTLLCFGNMLWSVQHPSLFWLSRVMEHLLGCSSLLALLQCDLTLTLSLPGQHLYSNCTEAMLISLILE